LSESEPETYEIATMDGQMTIQWRYATQQSQSWGEMAFGRVELYDWA